MVELARQNKNIRYPVSGTYSGLGIRYQVMVSGTRYWVSGIGIRYGNQVLEFLWNEILKFSFDVGTKNRLMTFTHFSSGLGEGNTFS